MKYINWNIKCYCNIDKIIAFLQSKADTSDCVIALEEVMPDKAEIISRQMSQNFWIIYSIDYRQPDAEFDTDNRRLGVMFLVSRDFTIDDSGVFARALFPERTLYATICKDAKKTKIVALHSITGVAFKMAKAVRFRNFAECIRDYKPDIISMDANEPKIDHFDISKMTFWDQGDEGQGADLFFKQLQKMGLQDAYASVYDENEFVYGEPLTTSHIVNNKINRRYDFVFASNEYEITQADYLYEEACEASSDHAMVWVELK